MAKSRTRKKSVKENIPPEVKEISDAATGYIKFWTTRELWRMQQAQQTPICLPLKNGYKIGIYTLKTNKNHTCEVFDINHESIHTFNNKVSAILYTIYTIKNKLTKAWEILALDKEINKNYADVQAMRRGQKHALGKKDYETVDIRQARLEIAQKQLEEAQDKISKIHLHAKYNKIWL
jgi:uncharacterized protein (UPF0179 family)